MTILFNSKYIFLPLTSPPPKVVLPARLLLVAPPFRPLLRRDHLLLVGCCVCRC